MIKLQVKVYAQGPSVWFTNLRTAERLYIKGFGATIKSPIKCRTRKALSIWFRCGDLINEREDNHNTDKDFGYLCKAYNNKGML